VVSLRTGEALPYPYANARPVPLSHLESYAIDWSALLTAVLFVAIASGALVLFAH